jgi:tRNA(Ile2) C34 agmatinyltransferase TiaS
MTFIIRCDFCKWQELNSGLPKDLAHLFELKNTCDKCGKPRRFRCPKCGRMAKMKRI